MFILTVTGLSCPWTFDLVSGHLLLDRIKTSSRFLELFDQLRSCCRDRGFLCEDGIFIYRDFRDRVSLPVKMMRRVQLRFMVVAIGLEARSKEVVSTVQETRRRYQ
jgi:hypothetical protein